jgi:hypothetical protein
VSRNLIDRACKLVHAAKRANLSRAPYAEVDESTVPESVSVSIVSDKRTDTLSEPIAPGVFPVIDDTVMVDRTPGTNSVRVRINPRYLSDVLRSMDTVTSCTVDKHDRPVSVDIDIDLTGRKPVRLDTSGSPESGVRVTGVIMPAHITGPESSGPVPHAAELYQCLDALVGMIAETTTIIGVEESEVLGEARDLLRQIGRNL